MEVWLPDLNLNITGISRAQQANILTIIMEEYSVNAWMCSYTVGHSMRFLNFRDGECPICRVCHSNCWSLANGKDPNWTLVICHKTGQRRKIGYLLPF